MDSAKPVLRKAIQISQQTPYWHCRLLFQLAVRKYQCSCNTFILSVFQSCTRHSLSLSNYMHWRRIWCPPVTCWESEQSTQESWAQSTRGKQETIYVWKHKWTPHWFVFNDFIFPIKFCFLFLAELCSYWVKEWWVQIILKIKDAVCRIWCIL